MKIAEKSMVLQAIFTMVDAESKNTQMIAARTACNLVLCDQVGLSTMIPNESCSIFTPFLFFFVSCCTVL